MLRDRCESSPTKRSTRPPETLADRSRQPNLRTVVLAGFSGGGQLVQRYAAVGRVGDTLANRGIALRYVVGSPSS